MLIIEGPDGVGKTTLAKRLVKELTSEGYIYAHFTRLPPGFDRYWGYWERMSRKIVQDRFHMSEITYANAREEVTPLDPETYRLIDGCVRLYGGMTVLILASQELIESRWTHDQMFSLEKTKEAGRQYDKLSRDGGLMPDFRSNRIIQIDIDYTFYCSKDFPYVTDGAIDEILKQYRERQFIFKQVVRRRETSFEAQGLH